MSWETVSLDYAPDYTAVSYTWGLQSPRDLELSRQTAGLRLTENLSSAMLCLGSIAPGLYWFDALCINQEDDEEKTAQVAMMRDIYSKAQRVVAYLGPKDSETNTACELIRQLCTLFVTGRLDLKGEALKVSVPVAKTYPFRDEKLQELGLPSTDAQDWVALANLLNRPYFTRVWVLQELVMAPPDIHVFCGSYEMRWDALQITQRCLLALGWRDKIQQLLIEQGKSPEMPALDLVSRATTLMYYREEKLGLQMLLDMSRFLLATDPRDKIIALLGMARESEKDKAAVFIQPDYGRSVQELYKDVTGQFIMAGSLELLSSVEGDMRQIEGLPTWVPDYSALLHNGSFAIGYEAGGMTSVSATWLPGSGILRLDAEIVDTVEVVSLHAGQASEYQQKLLLEFFCMAAAHTGSGDEWHWLSLLAEDKSEAGLDAFWRTMIGDRTSNNNCPAPEEYRNHFAAYIAEAFVMIMFDTSKEAQEKMCAIPDGPALLGKGESGSFVALWQDIISGNVFFITESGRMGIGPKGLQRGDRVSVFRGGSPVYLLREGTVHYQFLGDGYVHGLMHGEGLTEDDDNFKEISLR